MTRYYFKIKIKNTKYTNIVYIEGFFNDDFRYDYLERKVINNKKINLFIQFCANKSIDSTSIWIQR